MGVLLTQCMGALQCGTAGVGYDGPHTGFHTRLWELSSQLHA